MASPDTTAESGRAGKVAAAAEGWAGRLIDLTRRNNLLYFRDLKTGTLDLADADDDQRARLLAGQPVRASKLFPADAGLQQTRRRLTEIRRKIRLLAEERGIDAGFVALGLLSWPVLQGARGTALTRAPVLLRPLTIAVKGANAADFELTLDEAAELNPVLTYALTKQMGVDTNGVTDRISATAPAERLGAAVTLLCERAAAAGVRVDAEDKIVAAVFSYEKMPMVRDLEESTALLAGHTLVAALAQDEEARRTLQARPDPVDVNPNAVDPGNEYLVLDADPSQQSAIGAALAGHDLIVQGPPGTGKSQTIANLIVEAVARGRKILFVAQKRAAIDAVVNNLRERDLADLVLDLHDPKTSRKAVAEQLRLSMERAGQAPPANVGAIRRTLVERRRQLQQYSEIMTAIREPSGSSIAELQQRLLMLAPERDPGLGLSASTLARISSDALSALEEDLKQFVESDGLRLWRGHSPWANARGITGQDDLQAARARLDQLTGRGLQDARRDLGRLLAATGLPRPATLAQWNDALRLMSGVARTVAAHGPEVFDSALDDYRAAFGTRAWRRDAGVSTGFWRRRSLRRVARERRSGRVDRATMFAELSDAVAQRDLWARLTGGHAPRPADGLDELLPRYERLRDDLAAIGATAIIDGLAERPEPEMDRVLNELKADEGMLVRLPGLNAQRTRYEELGLSELLDHLVHRNAEPVEAAEVLRFAWLSSTLRELRATVPEFGRFSAAAQRRVIEEFQEADLSHIETTAARVRRRVAEQQMHARDRWRDQRSIVQDQIARRSRHKPIRQLVDETSDLLLAVRPCWAMSPLVVSQVLPDRRLFDLVVFDEASQIEPADAIPAIVRGEHVVVAGDNKQLPPTPFFSTAVDEDDETEENGALGAFESILDVLGPLVPARTLAWHYRSQDDRLIAFSNTAIYDDQLVTFPGTTRQSALRHVLVDSASSPGAGNYSLAEAERVVELVVEHAEQNPDDSLGVIALGVNAANRIQNLLRQVLTGRPDLDDFFDEDAPVRRRFFVKSIENVQGDERDAIILTVGGSRTATGTFSHNFGPINQQGGERRLNVAVTRARRSMTVVSTFGPHDFIEERLTGRGLRFLRDYLRFAGQVDREGWPDDRMPDTRVSPIEQRLIEQLRAAGVPTFPRYGTSRSRIEVAVEHPDRPGLLLLAIDTDRDGYHAPERSVRERDRLRPQQLEKMGWRHYRVWSTEWLRDPHGQVEQVLGSLSSALKSAESIERIADASVPARHLRTDVVESTAAPQRALPRPSGIVEKLPIEQYPRSLLIELARWIDSDGLLRDEEEMIDLMKAELGFQRRGKKIVAALQRAVSTARGQSGP